MVRGERVFLSRGDQMLASAWAYLKVALLAQVDKRRSFIPDQRFREIFTRAQEGGMKVPQAASVFIAAHDGELLGQYQHRLLGLPGSSPDLFVGTFTLRHLTLQVVEHLASDVPVLNLEREPEIELAVGRIWFPSTRHLRLWPPARGLRFPLGPALSDVGLTAFTGPEPGSGPSNH